jgi:hypothetical protein
VGVGDTILRQGEDTGFSEVAVGLTKSMERRDTLNRVGSRTKHDKKFFV